MNLKLKKWSYPFIKSSDSNRSLMIDMIISLVPLYFMASWYYGMRASMLCLISLITATASDGICTLIAGKKINIRDYSPIVTALILPLIMPANIPYYVLITAVLFAIVVAKHPFGGSGQNIFNPAAAGFAFATICWPQQIFSYPVPLEKLNLTSQTIVKLAENPAYSLKADTLSQFDFSDMLLGAFAGPMGATSILLIISCKSSSFTTSIND
ncbi:MAG: RnfABCDGE type electron transport complex subunit D, partial [Oscillospiraceae bacterium]